MTKIRKHMYGKLPMALGIVAIAGIMLTITTLSTTTAQITDVYSLPVDEYKSLFISRAQIATTVALSDPTVKQHTNSALKVATDFELLDNTDKVIVRTWNERIVSGDWHKGYLISYKGGKIIEILVDRSSNAVTSTQVLPRPDLDRTEEFTANQKHILGIAMSDQRVRMELQGMVDGKDYWIQMVRDYDIGSKIAGHQIAIINIFSPDEKNALSVDVDLVTQKVIDLKSNFRQGGK